MKAFRENITFGCSYRRALPLKPLQIIYSHPPVLLKPRLPLDVPSFRIHFNPMPPSLLTAVVRDLPPSSRSRLPGSVSLSPLPTLWLLSKIRTPQHGPGSSGLSPCLHFRPHLLLIHSPPFPLVPSKANPLCGGKW